MPRYYCDYCDTYLTHDSPSVRKQHGQGYKHKANVRLYYQQFEEQQTQILIDQRIKEHLGKTQVYQPVGAAYNQHLASMQGQRPPMSLLPTPTLPNAGNPQLPMNLQMFHGIRPPVLPRPLGIPGYMSAPTMPQMMAPPGAPSFPGQANGTLGPPTVSAPPSIPGSTTTPNSSAAPSPGMYHINPAPPTSGGYDQH